MRILVTGGAGFIGSHLAERLVEQGHDVVILDDFSSGSRRNLDAIRDRVSILEGSILDVGEYRSELGDVERIYHLAALISGHDSLFDAERYHHVNVVGLLRLIEVARDLTGCRLIFASSSTVYGSCGDPVKRESDRVQPLSVYALTKYMGEHTLALYSQLHGFDWVALRLFNVYGPRQSPDHPYANVTCKFSHAAAHEYPVRLYGGGEQTRDFVYVDDVVDAFLGVGVESNSRVYNVGTGQETSIKRLLDEVQAVSSTRLEVERHPPWPNDITRICADASLLERDLNVRARVPLAEGLRRTVEWFRREPA